MCGNYYTITKKVPNLIINLCGGFGHSEKVLLEPFVVVNLHFSHMKLISVIISILLNT